MSCLCAFVTLNKRLLTYLLSYFCDNGKQCGICAKKWNCSVVFFSCSRSDRTMNLLSPCTTCLYCSSQGFKRSTQWYYPAITSSVYPVLLMPGKLPWIMSISKQSFLITCAKWSPFLLLALRLLVMPARSNNHSSVCLLCYPWYTGARKVQNS